MMTKNLHALLQRTDEIVARKDELIQRREQIRAAKEKIFDSAAANDDKAFAKIGELGSQENLLTVSIERADRELAGMAATLLNETTEVRRTCLAKLRAKRAEMIGDITAALAPFYPAKCRKIVDKLMTDEVTPKPPALVVLTKAANALTYEPFSARDGRSEFDFARQTLATVERFLAECGL